MRGSNGSGRIKGLSLTIHCDFFCCLATLLSTENKSWANDQARDGRSNLRNDPSNIPFPRIRNEGRIPIYVFLPARKTASGDTCISWDPGGGEEEERILWAVARAKVVARKTLTTPVPDERKKLFLFNSAILSTRAFLRSTLTTIRRVKRFLLPPLPLPPVSSFPFVLYSYS